MKDIFDSKVLCEKCNTLTTKKTMVKEGFQIRILECPKCGNILFHPVDVEKYNEFNRIKKKQFNVKLRMVGNSYTVSIPKEIIDFFNEEEEQKDPFEQIHKKMKEDMERMNRMVTLAFKEANTLSLNFGPEGNYERTIEKDGNIVTEKAETRKLPNGFITKKIRLIKSNKNKKELENE
ncbi:MAG: hypothetical protein PHD81_01750 [Candidatus Nanoarchaeia archaeon]|nr:hypothetical protein [Candidatus Nanoarchaeia archaeon]MDD5587813.1 hypothetical protein [Candidatus Nanoarchaeia archaeon]